MRAYIPVELRRIVVERAKGCCEYCRVAAADRNFSYSVDHIIATKHGGATTDDNLCYCCMYCNRFKGTDFTSMDWKMGRIVTMVFDPRRNRWDDHFRINDGIIEPLTATGRVTVALLHFNDRRYVEERTGLIELDRYPCPA